MYIGALLERFLDYPNNDSLKNIEISLLNIKNKKQ